MRLWFDTNAIWRKPSELRAITDLARAKGVRPLASAQVYLEDRRQTQIRLGPRFRAEVFDAVFNELFEIVDVPFNATTAARWADRLAARYPSQSAWREACRATLGGELLEQYKERPARVPMTTDWWVALVVEEDDDSLVVCHERSGEEWRVLREAGRAIPFDEAVARLRALPGERY